MSKDIKNEIPEEYQVIIEGTVYDKRQYYIKQDYLNPDNYINTSVQIYNSFNIIVGIDERGLLIETGYTLQSTGRLKKITISYSLINYKHKERFFFKNDGDIEEFCKKYDFKYGELTRCYYHTSMIKYDRREPNYFNYTKSKFDDNYIISHNVEINKKSVEYNELINHLNCINEKNGVNSKTFLSFEGLQYTFGVEMETVTGSFTTDNDFNTVKDLNISSVKDGSLRDADGSGPWGAEYVTGVLKGDSGLEHLHKITKVLSKKCTVDKRASVHVHIGSLKWNSEDIVYAYLLGLMLEDEIFSMMPQSRMDNQYCKKLPKIDPHMLGRLNKTFDKSDYKKIINLVYNKVFKIVSKGYKPSKEFNKNTRHPQGPHGGWDRDTDHRYSWLNFTNIIFNQRGNFNSKTIEFRCHSGTLSYKKIHNWIKICMAIVEFINIGKKDILKAILSNETIKLEDIISRIYPKSHKRLNDYIKLRKELFSMSLNENIDYVTEDSNIKSIKDIICV